MAASDALHPDLFGGIGRYPPARTDTSADVVGPMHGPREPPMHGPPKPFSEKAQAGFSADRAAARPKAFAFGQLEPTQLPLFMGARDLLGTINTSHDTGPISEYASHYGLSSGDLESGEYAGEHEELHEMWGRKLAESKMGPETGVHGSGVHESISREGWRPHASVTLNWNKDEEGWSEDVSIHDAHHRVAAAADIEETSGKNVWIPTHHQTQDWY